MRSNGWRPRAAANAPQPKAKLCALVDCGRKRHAKGLCRLHSDRLREKGRVEVTARRPRVEGRASRWSGSWTPHALERIGAQALLLQMAPTKVIIEVVTTWARAQTSRTPLEGAQLRGEASSPDARDGRMLDVAPGGLCAAAACGRATVRRGLCDTHARRMSSTGTLGGPIRPAPGAAVGLVLCGGFRLRPEVAQIVLEEAQRRRLSPNALICDVVEAWAARA